MNTWTRYIYLSTYIHRCNYMFVIFAKETYLKMLIMKNAFTSMTTRIGILLSTNIIKVWMKISLYSVNNPIMIYVEWARMLSDCICCLYLLINTTMMGNIFYLNILFCTSFNLDLLVFCIEHKMHPPIK